MVSKILKSNILALRYEHLNDLGTNVKKRQSFSFLPLATSDDDFYNLAKQISDALRVPANTIEQSTTLIYTEV